MAPPRLIPHSEARLVLRRAGFGADAIERILAQVPDPINLDDEHEVALLAHEGVTSERLMDLLGSEL